MIQDREDRNHSSHRPNNIFCYLHLEEHDPKTCRGKRPEPCPPGGVRLKSEPPGLFNQPCTSSILSRFPPQQSNGRVWCKPQGSMTETLQAPRGSAAVLPAREASDMAVAPVSSSLVISSSILIEHRWSFL